MCPIVYAERWSPSIVDRFSKPLKESKMGLRTEEIKNIAYSLQYLQFIQLELDELHLHNIVEQQLWKTYIITAMSIIECIFNSIVKANGKQYTNKWTDGTQFISNEINQNGVIKQYRVFLYEKLQQPIDVEMNFFELIDVVEKKRLISFRTKGYKDLRSLKNIRNRVHLSVREMNDTDYYAIKKEHYLLSRRYLFFVITNEKLNTTISSNFDFINLTEDENNISDAYIEHLNNTHTD